MGSLLQLLARAWPLLLLGLHYLLSFCGNLWKNKTSLISLAGAAAVIFLLLDNFGDILTSINKLITGCEQLLDDNSVGSVFSTYLKDSPVASFCFYILAIDEACDMLGYIFTTLGVAFFSLVLVFFVAIVGFFVKWMVSHFSAVFLDAVSSSISGKK